VRARFGYATGNMLHYLTVGSMATRFENTATTGFTVTSSALRPGWAFGGGFEAVMVDQLILRTEVLFMQTPQHNENLGFGIKASDSSTNTVARVAVLYKFGGGYKPQPAMRP
jgi:opacity protein-like surface antigen